MISAFDLKRLLHYDCDTGVFTRLVRVSNRAAGTVVGCVDGGGYLSVAIRGKYYKLHRLAWLYMTGEWPRGDIDHINGIKTDNRFCNLRDCSTRVNTQNQRRARSDSATGLLGAAPHASGRFQANININGKQTYLGMYDTAEDAHAAYLEAKRRLHPGCTI